MNKETEVLVVGGGPAGLLAAIRAARLGARVTLVDKNKVLGRKLRITGKGRCNITNTGEIHPFIRQYGKQGKFLYSAFTRFFHQDICRLLAEAGVETKEERGGRVFPLSDQAADVAEGLERLAEGAGAEILRSCKVERLNFQPLRDETLIQKEKQRVVGVSLYDPWDRSEIRAQAVVLATGGMSYPLTGSTGDGYGWAGDAGHRITEIRPALVPLASSDEWPGALAGLALKNVKAALWAVKPHSGNAAKLAEFQGEMLFAHFGLTGPIILSLSRYFRDDGRTYTVTVDLKPALSAEVLDKRLQRDFVIYQKKQLLNAMADLLPRALIPAVIRQAGLEENQPVAELTRAQRLKLGQTLKALPVVIAGTRPMEEAIVTMGGVALPEVDPKTMGSKITAGLYFAGELLDLDGFTGGYNLQAAFSTGWVAGESAAKQCGMQVPRSGGDGSGV